MTPFLVNQKVINPYNRPISISQIKEALPLLLGFLFAIAGLIGLARVFAAAPVITLLVTVALILFAIAFLKPTLGILFWAGLLGFQIETLSTLGVNIALADFILIALLLNVAIRISLKRVPLVKTKMAKWLFGLIVVFTIGLFTTLKTFGFLPKYAIINKYLGFFLLIAQYYVVVTIVNNRQILSSLLSALFYFGCMVNHFVLSLYLLHITKIGSGSLFHSLISVIVEGERLRGFLLDPNAYGGFVVLLLIFGLFDNLRVRKRSPSTEQDLEKKHNGLLAIINLLSLSLALLFTFSRTAWLGFAFALPIILKSYGLSLKTGLILVLGIILIAQVPALFQFLKLDPKFLIFRDFTLRERLALIVAGFRAFCRSPIFGIGLGAFREVLPTIIHNSYIWLLVEMGPFAFLFLLGLFIQALRLAKNGEGAYPRFCYASLFAFYGIGLGIEVLYQRHLWLLFGLAELIAKWQVGRSALVRLRDNNPRKADQRTSLGATVGL